MGVCELDNEVSGEILGWKLPAWQALLLHRVFPSCGGLVNYLFIICFDFALVYEHYQNKSNVLAVFCLIIIILPAVISLVFTLASPPPTLLPDDSSFHVKIKKSDIKWIFMQLGNAIFFPIAAVGRYSYLIFWWVEAVFAAHSQDEERTQAALTEVRAPSSVELYLFLQAFVHSAPLAVINLLDMMSNYKNPTYDKMLLQAVSLIASSLRMASTATLYRRFEREKICGRRYPWNNKFDDNIENIHKNEINKPIDDEPIYEPIIQRKEHLSSNTQLDNIKEKVNSDFIQFSPRHSLRNSTFYDDYCDCDSDTSSDYMPPTNKQEVTDSDDEYVKPITIIDKVAPRRRETYNIEQVNVTPPPMTYAPRPGSFAVWAEKLVENAESIPAWLSAPPRRKHVEVIQDEPDLPRRMPRSRIRGLEPQDATAAFIHFLAWYGFFVARLLSLAAFINFSPFFSIIVLFIHYQIMLLLLIVPQAPTVRRAFYIFLAFIYLFCLMEFKIRFRHVRVWHIFWFLVCSAEIVIFISLWSTIDNPLHNWWNYFIVIVTICSMLLSYMLFLMYFLMLQPRETVVHVDNIKSKSLKVNRHTI
ncbi:uncharacterized protein LOC119829728 [Zerene cesonia]|uniref:uncharacterized protein LOC119829728 n=1 Tax=Zerene cesonia TaxID=33412 RepID=UPI0018E507F2|nr:uncharacterized protein LOC119829728 [Zerene cesonia]